MRLAIVIPSLNEATGIAKTLERLPRAELERVGYEVDVLVVDGASTDGTPDVAQSLGARVVTEGRRGYGRAYKAGFDEVAQADVVVTADADDTYPLDALPDWLRRFDEESWDFVTINRFAQLAPGSMRRMHWFGNRALSLAARLLFWVRVGDSQSGMWIIRRRVRAGLPLHRMGNGMSFSQEIKLVAMRNRAWKSSEWRGRYYPRVGEEKLMSWRDGLANLWRLVAFRFRRLKAG